ncbi:hypothetical protein ACVGOW_27495 [Pseudonocardia saturnea]
MGTSISASDDPQGAMGAPIRIEGIHLAGITKDYSVSFLDDSGDIRPLSIIAGEISTGKTSTLELIDYCLGASSHPQHEEILEAVRGVRLAIRMRKNAVPEEEEVDGSEGSVEETDEPSGNSTDLDPGDQRLAERGPQVAHYVLERSFPGPSPATFLFRGRLAGLDSYPPKRLSMDPNDEESVSQFLLGASGLAGLRVKQAPTQVDSSTHILSFRDVAPLYYLTHRRLDNGDLVFEHQPFRSLKIRQVVDYIFGVSDAAISSLAAQIEELTKRRAEARTGIKALNAFLREQGVEDQMVLDAEMSQLERQIREAELEFAAINGQVRASTEFAVELRESYEASRIASRTVASQLRERETLRSRLNPLRSQYADDLRKLTMLIEARRLFDPLSVVVCPACQSDLAQPPQIVEERCTLCNSAVPHLVHQELHISASPDAGEGVLDVNALDGERRSVAARLRELTDFIEQIEEEISRFRARQLDADTGARQLQLQLDEVTRGAIAPYLAERDIRSENVVRLRGAISQVRQRMSLQNGLEQRRLDEDRLAGSLGMLRERLREINASNTSRDSMVSLLSQRFHSILAAFGFPKLSDAFIDTRLIPHARMVRYDQIGSSGAMTLLSLAWQLAIFELSVERGAGHPGFLMIDSPQKNLKAASERREWDDATASSIVDRIYRHILDWLNQRHGEAQVIVVDNSPPSWLDDYVVVRYSGDPEVPPYGLIDDSTA